MNEVIANNLKRFRKANNLTIEQIAGYLGVKNCEYINYEEGKCQIPLYLLERSAVLFGCALELLLEEDEKKVKEMSLPPITLDWVTIADLKEIAHFKRMIMEYDIISELLKN